MASDPCPCGSPLGFGACCRPRHAGLRPAETAEALMRSRYAAFARGEIGYLVRTLHPSRRSLDTAAGLRETVESTRWTGLAVLDTRAGGPTDEAGEVEFVAFFERFADAGTTSSRTTGSRTTGELHERSRFVREAGAWLYVDAMPSRRSPPTRNEPCWCGSSKRYRRCHGRR